jgi:peptidoglycan/xylan/chitin deacetylase (PgdA/CDA1 family)
MEIGTHGMHHRDWRKLSDAELRVELVAARQRVEDICGTAVTKAGIPFGSYDRRLVEPTAKRTLRVRIHRRWGIGAIGCMAKTTPDDLQRYCRKRNEVRHYQLSDPTGASAASHFNAV